MRTADRGNETAAKSQWPTTKPQQPPIHRSLRKALVIIDCEHASRGFIYPRGAKFFSTWKPGIYNCDNATLRNLIWKRGHIMNPTEQKKGGSIRSTSILSPLAELTYSIRKGILFFRSLRRAASNIEKSLKCLRLAFAHPLPPPRPTLPQGLQTER